MTQSPRLSPTRRLGICRNGEHDRKIHYNTIRNIVEKENVTKVSASVSGGADLIIRSGSVANKHGKENATVPIAVHG